MTDVIVTEITFRDLNDADRYWLVKGCLKASWREMTAMSVVQSAMKGDCFLYRISGGAEGIMVASRDGKGYIVEMLSGKGILRQFSGIHEAAKNFAKEKGCSSLIGCVDREGLHKFYRDHTQAKPVMTMYSEPLS